MIPPIRGASGAAADSSEPIANQLRTRLQEFIDEFREDPTNVDTLRKMQSTILGLDSLSRSGANA
ncbi:MAG: hypothetical protein JSR58_00520 [Verrucomicrobia bacterium]|nr:hypothetical protein [Verrucomicrobiota bacterium]